MVQRSEKRETHSRIDNHVAVLIQLADVWYEAERLSLTTAADTAYQELLPPVVWLYVPDSERADSLNACLVATPADIARAKTSGWTCATKEPQSLRDVRQALLDADCVDLFAGHRARRSTCCGLDVANWRPTEVRRSVTHPDQSVDDSTLDRRRWFTRSDVRRVWERQGRVCNLCRREVPIDWVHGDHIKPWILGGRTVLENCQALCGSCNLRKGSQPQEEIERLFDPGALQPGASDLRAWQAEAVELTTGLILERPVLVEACPGAGKTRFGLEVAYQLLAAGEVTRVLVVTPTRGITDGWRAAAARSDPGSPSIPLLAAPRWTAVRPILEQWAGAVLTYQSLVAAPDMLMAHATDPGHQTLVVFDEVHHISADNRWGVAAQEAFAQTARAILSLSGTAFRTDRNPIAFVRSDGGSAVPDYRYGYRQAMDDEACRPVQFVRTGGRTVFRDRAGVVHDVVLDDDSLNEAGESKRLRAALEFVEPGSMVDFMLQSANQFLLELRESGDRDAAGLVVTVDCDHADEIARHMQHHVTAGDRPVVACSRLQDPNDPEPGTAISQFRTRHDPWLVAVNMVSEGVDIRRLRCIVYLTNRLTDLSFRQIVGRVVRSDPANGIADYGRVYIVGDRRLIGMAESILDDIDYGPADMIFVTPDRPQSPPGLYGPRSSDGSFETLATEGVAAGVSDTDGTTATADLVRLAQRYIVAKGLANTTPESLALLAADNEQLHKALRGVDS